MFSVDDLFQLCSDKDAVREFLQEHGFQESRPETCPKCGDPVDETVYLRNGKDHWRCRRKGCQRWLPVQSGNLESSKLPPHKIIQILYFWARDSHKLNELLGLDAKTVADWFARLRLCVANESIRRI